MKPISLRLITAFLCIVAFGACTSKKAVKNQEGPKVQATSLFGDELYAPTRSEEQQGRLLQNLAEAQKQYDHDPNELNTIWLGRRHAYLTDYNQAIETFTNGLKQFPDSYRLYRHRGHRYVSTRQFDKAIADFKAAYELMPKDTTEIEPDGIPNKLNTPLSNTQFNVLYHYGLAHYLKGEFAQAEAIYRECLDYSGNPDLWVATSDWLYMTLRRQNKTAEADAVLATIADDLEIIENDSYFKRLMMYKGKLAIEELFKTNEADAALSLATQGYGMANWYLYNGDTTKAREIYTDILKGSSWSPFGYIAAEADLLHIGKE